MGFCPGSRWPASPSPSPMPFSRPSRQQTSHGDRGILEQAHDQGSGLEMTSGPAPAERIQRHKSIDRAYHWLMAASVLILLLTAFLPILGIKFEWVGIHWVTGLVLTVIVLFHIIRATIWQNFWAMMIDGTDLSAPFAKPGKYSPAQKLYHLA